jgi:glycosyltransferase involved in cell wall biosynthesis
MYKSKKIGVVIRAHNERNFILSVVDSLPIYIDHIYLVNDASTDGTLDLITNLPKQDPRIVIVNHTIRKGAGYAAISGQQKALSDNNDIIAMIDGDGQMDATRLPDFLDPLISGQADYAKGNRFSNKKDLKGMPSWRILGNFILTILTRISSGYWNVSDPQNGYTAITTITLRKINLDRVYKGFAYENDMLVKLNAIGAKIIDIPHPAIYGDQNSKIHYPHFIITTSWLLLKDFIWRKAKKYSKVSRPLVKGN